MNVKEKTDKVLEVLRSLTTHYEADGKEVLEALAVISKTIDLDKKSFLDKQKEFLQAKETRILEKARARAEILEQINSTSNDGGAS